MDIDSFAAITDKIAKRDGVEAYLPTLCFPARSHVMVLEGIPKNVSHERAAKKWAAENVQNGEPYILAWRSGASEITVEWHESGKGIVSRKLSW